jgi:hypothetical protein
MPWSSSSGARLKRLFDEGFTVMDIAEPLVSFDGDRPATEVRSFMEARGFDLVGIRLDGLVAGYGMQEELAGGLLGDHLHRFGPDDLVTESASLREAILSLGINKRCFVAVLDRVSAIITLSDLEKPPVRMFLFGMITLFEDLMTRQIRDHFPGDSWRSHVSPGRLAKAEGLWQERLRRNQKVELMDCLQFSDRGQLLVKVPRVMQDMKQRGITSKNAATTALKELETLRNNLAHTQEIIPSSWERIVRFTSNLESLLPELR